MTIDDSTPIEVFKEAHKKDKNKRFLYFGFKCKSCQKIVSMSLRSLMKKKSFLCRDCLWKENSKNIDWAAARQKGWSKITPDINKKRIEKMKQTKKDKYGDENYNNYITSVETTLNKYGYKYFDYNKVFKTNLKKYGNRCSLHGKEIHEKVVKTCLKKYGVPSLVTAKSLYKYDNYSFDSSWELLLYIYLKNNNISFEYHPKIYFKYGDNKKYYPDFIIENKIYEIKGEQFFINDKPIYKLNNKSWKDKYDCMISNNVIILRKKDLIEKYDLFSQNIDISQYKTKK